MYIKIAILLGMLGHLSSGVPLEHPAQNFKQFFEPRIIGGQNAAEGSAPHMGALVFGHFVGHLSCGVSIISRTHALTAAHCITSFINWDGSLLDTLRLLVGSNQWAQGTAVQIKDYRIHPDYDSWTIKHDIGVLTTDTINLVKDRVAIIPLHFDHVDGGKDCVVFGWGTEILWGSAAQDLQYLEVRTLSHEECAQAIHELQDSYLGMLHVDAHAEICTFHSLGHGTCHGDSGSALMLSKLKKQIGIVSWGFPCALGAPDMFVRTGSYRDFIEGAMRGTA